MQTEKQRERLVELLDKAFLKCDDNYGRPCTEQVAHYLMLEFGKTVFLSREEAENVLKERNNAD